MNDENEGEKAHVLFFPPPFFSHFRRVVPLSSRSNLSSKSTMDEESSSQLFSFDLPEYTSWLVSPRMNRIARANFE